MNRARGFDLDQILANISSGDHYLKKLIFASIRLEIQRQRAINNSNRDLRPDPDLQIFDLDVKGCQFYLIEKMIN